MSIFGKLLNAGISVPGPEGVISFEQTVKFNQGWAESIGRGKVFYVSSLTGSDYNTGLSPGQAVATVNKAMDKVTAGRGDVIYLLPGHAETISGALGFVMDVSCVSVIGLGTGALRPIFTFTAAASTISITASSCVLSNIVLLSYYTNGVTVGIEVAATALGLVLDNIEMRETVNTQEWLIGIRVGAACHGVIIQNLKYFGLAGGSTTQAVIFSGASNYSIVRNFLIYGDFSGAGIDALTAASIWITIGPGVLHNLDTSAGLTVSVKSDTSGFMYDLRMSGLLDTATPAGAAMCACEVYVSNAIFKQGIPKPALDT